MERRVVVLVDIFTIRCDKLNQRMVFAADVAKAAGASEKDSKGCCQEIKAIGTLDKKGSCIYPVVPFRHYGYRKKEKSLREITDGGTVNL